MKYTENEAKKIIEKLQKNYGVFFKSIKYEIQDFGEFLLIIAELKERLSDIEHQQLHKQLALLLAQDLPEVEEELSWSFGFKFSDEIIDSIMAEYDV